MKAPALIFLSIMTAWFISSCRDPGNADQAYIAIREEFDSGKYENVMEAIRRYGHEVGTNSYREVLLMQTESLEKIAGHLNSYLPAEGTEEYVRRNLDRYGRYGIRFYRIRFHYDGRHYRTLYYHDPEGKRKAAHYLEFIGRIDPYRHPEIACPEMENDFLAEGRRTLRAIRSGAIGDEHKARIAAALISPYLAVSRRADGTVKPAFFPELERISDTVTRHSRVKDELEQALYLKLFLLRETGRDKQTEEVLNSLLDHYGGRKFIAWPYYLIANGFYREGDSDAALKFYYKAFGRINRTPFTPDELRDHFIGFPDNAHFRQAVVGRIDVIKAEREYREFLRSGEVAAISGYHVYLRSSRDYSTKENIITTLSTGDKVIKLERSAEPETIGGYTDHWYLVRLRNGDKGWIFGKYLLFF